MRKAVFAVIISFSLSGLARAQDAPAPCGPAGQLPAQLSGNVAADSRCFELRMYTADPARDGVGNFEGGIDQLHQRFREKEVEIFENHGAEIIAVWQNLDDPNTLIWDAGLSRPRPSARGLGGVRRRPGMDRAQTEVQRADRAAQCLHDECNRLLAAQVDTRQCQTVPGRPKQSPDPAPLAPRADPPPASPENGPAEKGRHAVSAAVVPKRSAVGTT